ncbi:MAG: nitroreductase/quinone reductase family protein [Carbonactinosporaceae bacterium]
MNPRLYDPAMRAAVLVLTTSHVMLRRLSGGRLGDRIPGVGQIVWLSTIGRRSGKRRRTPLLAVRDGAEPAAPYVVTGSNGGQSVSPGWVFNLRAHPEAGIEVNGTSYAVRAEEVTDEAERVRLYGELTRSWRGYAGYARQTSRRLPVFRLHLTTAHPPKS